MIIKENNLIKKIFSKEEDFFTEYYFYQEYKDFPFIPKLIKAEKNALYLEYINGKNLYEVGIEEQLCLAKTLAKFHNSPLTTHYSELTLHHDTNLKNYIYTKDKVYMIDFSDISIGHPLSDVYSALLFFAELHPPEIFQDFHKRFLEIYFCGVHISICPPHVACGVGGEGGGIVKSSELPHHRSAELRSACVCGREGIDNSELRTPNSEFTTDILEKEIKRFEDRREKYGKYIMNYQYYLKNRKTLRDIHQT